MAINNISADLQGLALQLGTAIKKNPTKQQKPKKKPTQKTSLIKKAVCRSQKD